MLSQVMFNELKDRHFPQLEVCVDLFASRLNKISEKYVSWRPDPGAFALDVFTLNWGNFDYIYLFPTFSLITRVVQKVREDRATGLLIVPDWPTQCWFPLIKLIQPPRILKMDKWMISPIDEEVADPLAPTLLACPLSGAALNCRDSEIVPWKSRCTAGGDPQLHSTRLTSSDGGNFAVLTKRACFIRVRIP
jgi:hypothetical protein